MISESTRRLTEELQKAVALREINGPGSSTAPVLIAGRYEVSAEITAYLQRMREYRAKARTVRVGQY